MLQLTYQFKHKQHFLNIPLLRTLLDRLGSKSEYNLKLENFAYFAKWFRLFYPSTVLHFYQKCAVHPEKAFLALQIN